MSCPSTWRSARRAAAIALLGAVPASTALAQVEDPRWRSSVELGGALSGNWLDGTRAPVVSSGLGVLGGLGISRGASPHVSGGVMMRVQSASVSLQEVGMTWQSGRTIEASMLAMSSFHSRRRTTFRLSLDVLGGVTVLSGPRDIVPFRDASNIAPTGEIGLSLRRGIADADASRADVALFVHYHLVRMRMNTSNAITSDGTVKRIIAGLRVTR